MRVPVLGVAVVLLLVVLPTSLGANPLDDDADSGGDASDVKPLALAVSPGSYAGRLTNTVDAADWYAFPVTEGELLEVRVQSSFWFVIGWIEDSAGESQGVSWGSAFRAYVEANDTWYLRVTTSTVIVENGNPRVPLIPPSYAFTIATVEPATLLVVRSDADWAAFEIAWNESAVVFAQARMDLASGALRHDPVGCTIHSEGSGQQAGGGYAFQGVLWLHGGAASNVVRVAPSPLPEQALPLPEMASGNGWGSSSVNIGEGTGSLRFATYCTAPAHTFSFLVVSDVALTSATVDGDGLTVWNEYDAAAESQVLTPALSVTGARSRSEVLDRTFFGFLHAPDGSEVYAVDPYGVRWDPRFGNSLFLADLAEGMWTFHVGATTGAALESVRNTLEGASVPFLGVSQPVVFPLF